MAMTNCRECGNQMSSKAISCPKCGAKRSRTISAAGWVFLALFGGAVLLTTLLARAQ